MPKKVDPNHRMGKRTGYTLIDGKYFLAPVLTQRIDELAAQLAGLQGFLKCVSRFCTDEFQRIEVGRVAWWKDVADDIGLDISPAIQWRYSHEKGYIEKMAPEEKKGP